MKKRNKYKLRFSLFILILLSLGFLLAFAYIDILRPAQNSYIAVCDPNAEEILKERGVYIKGAVTLDNATLEDIKFGQGITSEQLKDSNLTILLPDDATPSDYRHEYCHVDQIKKGRFYGCENSFKHYLNEVECYTTQDFPDWLYYMFYDKY